MVDCGLNIDVLKQSWTTESKLNIVNNSTDGIYIKANQVQNFLPFLWIQPHKKIKFMGKMENNLELVVTYEEEDSQTTTFGYVSII